MFRCKTLALGMIACVALQGRALAQDGKPWTFSTDISGTYNDNRDGTSDNKESQFEIRIRPRGDFKTLLGRGEFDVFYSPSFVYRTNPGENGAAQQRGTEIYHDFGLNVDYAVSSRLRMGLKEGFTLNDSPVDMFNAGTFREYAAYWANRFSAGCSYELMPARSIASARIEHMIKRYRSDYYAQTGDEKDLGASSSLKYIMQSGVALSCDVAYRTVDLGNSDSGTTTRNLKTLFVGVGAERKFGLWNGRIRVGMDQAKEKVIGSSFGFWGTRNSLAGDAEVNFTPSEATRIGLLAGQHLLRSDIAPFATQKRMSLGVNVAHDFSKQLSAKIEGLYAVGKYEGVSFVSAGGSDKVTSIGMSGSYLFSDNWRFTAGYRHEIWKADANLRASHNRNVLEVAAGAHF